MKLTKNIVINPPPFSNNQGQIINPPQININSEIFPIFTDNTYTKTVFAQIQNIPVQIILWSGADYENIGDWTQAQAESRLLEVLGDDPSAKLRSLYPKTLEEYPNLPGTVLSRMIKSVGIQMTDSCSCKRHALEMNDKGNDWCEQNIDTIVGWLREEATRRKLPFMDAIGKLIVNRAIKKSKKLLANEPVPENDEDLDQIQ